MISNSYVEQEYAFVYLDKRCIELVVRKGLGPNLFVDAPSALAAQETQAQAREGGLVAAAAPLTQAAPEAALAIVAAPGSPLTLVEERQAAQIGALQANLS